ncbi:MAG TPA: hydrogenase maturation nickel metallochaperone HypA [Candidatus Dormibacteraeota bacterium]|nr:hydrogenase maturation nickel metallochaperone HypA [Candidatus Dormibacteraeota bacterium]
MHEMGIARRLVAEALERREDDGPVTDVEVVLGAASGLSPEAVRLHFALAARDTPADGADVHVTLDPSRYWCFDCLYEFSSRAHGGATCPRCGGCVISLDREELAYVRAVGVG